MSQSNLYDVTKLISEKQRLEAKVREIFVRGIRPEFTSEENVRLGRVRLEFPSDQQHPLNYYSNLTKQTISMPIISLVFFEDLCTAYAWLWAKGYSLETIEEYLTMLRESEEYLVKLNECLAKVGYKECLAVLRHRWASDFIDRKFPLPPLTALQIPKDALKDGNVNALSLRFRNSGYAFILAHELGHLYHGHTNSNITNEEEADLFALKVMKRRYPTIPMGAVLWFQATAYYFQNRGDKVTHPLNWQRLHTLAEKLLEYVDDFTRLETDPAAGKDNIQFIAKGVEEIASVLKNVDLQRYMTAKARSANVSSLAPRPQTLS